MTLIVKDRVKESCSAPGTGTVSLLGAATGYQAFSAAIGNANTTYYAIQDQSGPNWEVGLGTYSSTGNTLARTTVLASSNSGSLVNFSSGTQDVWGDYPAGKSVYKDANGNITADSFSQNTIVDYETWTSQASNPSYAAGTLWYAQDNDALTFYNSVTNNDLHLGQEVQLRVYNSTGSTIAAGSVVYVNGQHSQFPTVALAQANSSSTSNAIGIANTSISNNSYGYVVVLGKFTGIDTHSFTAGDALYLSATSAGGIVNVMPTNPNLSVFIGYCVYSNPSQGVIEVNVPLPPVSASSLTGVVPVVSGGTGLSSTPANGQLLIGNGSGFTEATLTAGTGISVTNSAGGITITNTSPSSGGTVTSITAGTGLSGGTITSSGTIALANTAVSAGSYTNASLTVNAQGQITAASSGTAPVTSVTGTAPIASSGGATPAISISQATTSTNGYLNSTDWNTFNNKQAALVSGTNIKTINSNSILGSGDLAITASPAGSNTQIQYNNSGAFAGNSNFTINTTTGFMSAPVLQASNALIMNSTTVSSNVTVPTGNNAFSVGPVTTNSGVTVTVSSGQRWVVI